MVRSYHTNYPGLQNVNPQAHFQQQPQSQPQIQQNPLSSLFQDPRLQSNPIPFQAGANFVQGENRYFNDLQPSTKFHLPHGYDPNYSNINAFMNRPMTDISNQPHLLNPQGGIANNLGLQVKHLCLKQVSKSNYRTKLTLSKIKGIIQVWVITHHLRRILTSRIKINVDSAEI